MFSKELQTVLYGGAYAKMYSPSEPSFPSGMLHGPLAQLAEHRTFNPGVVGSIPTRPTKLDKIKNFFDQIHPGGVVGCVPGETQRMKLPSPRHSGGGLAFGALTIGWA